MDNETQTGGVNFGKGNEIKINGDVVGRDKNVFAEDLSYDVTNLENPYYLGLQAFGYDDRAFYAGRVALAQRRAQQLLDTQQTLLFIIGASGSGKSSFAQAGLLPALEARYLKDYQWTARRAVFRPTATPLARLEDALRKLGLPSIMLTDATADDISKTFANFLVENTPEHQVNLIVIDQFEEYLIHSDPHQRERLLPLLLELPPFDKARTHIVVTMRVDYQKELLDSSPELYDIAKQGVTLSRMTPTELKESIRRPLTVFCNGDGHERRPDNRYCQKQFEQALLDKLAEDAAQDAAFLPLLQVTLQDLWNKHILKLSQYSSLGDAISQRAENVCDFEDYKQGEQNKLRPKVDTETIIDIFLDLVEVSLDDNTERDVRRRRLKRDLEKGDPQRIRLIADLISARLLNVPKSELENVETTDSEPKSVEIIHESLIKHWVRLRDIISDNTKKKRQELQKRVRFEQRLREWSSNDRDEKRLLEGIYLQEAHELDKAGDIALLTGDAQDFLKRSVEREQSEQQRELKQTQAYAKTLRRRAIYLGAALLLAVIAAILAGLAQRQAANSAKAEAQQRQIADRNAAQAHSSALAARAEQALSENDTDIATSLAIAANTVVSSPLDQARTALTNIAYFSPGTRRRFVGHTGKVTGVAFSPDGHTALSSSTDHSLILWDLKTVTPELIIRRFLGHTDAVNSVAFSPDGRAALSASSDKTLILWDVATGKIIRRFLGHAGSVNSAVFSSDGRIALSGSSDSTMILWDVARGSEIRRYATGTNPVNQVAFSPDGQYAVSGLQDTSSQRDNLCLWVVAAGEKLRCFEGATYGVQSLAFSPDNRTVLVGSGGWGPGIYLWDVFNGNLLHGFHGHTGGNTKVAYSPDGRFAVSGASDNLLIVWNVNTQEPDRIREVQRLTGHTDDITSVAFSHDGTEILSGSADNTVRLWNLIGSAQIQQRTGIAIAVRPNTNMLFYTSVDRKEIIQWDIDQAKEMWHLKNPDGIYNLVVSPDGSRILSVFDNTQLRLLDAQSGAEIRRFVGHNAYAVNSVAFSPDGHKALSGAYHDYDNPNRNLLLWNVDTGTIIHELTGHVNVAVRSVAFHPDGHRAISGADDGIIILWDIETGKEIRRFVGHAGAVNGVAFSLNGRTILSGSTDQSLRLWDTETGKEIRRFAGLPFTIYAVAFHPDGHTVLAGLDDGSMSLWDIETGVEKYRIKAHWAPVKQVLFSANGRYAISWARDSTIGIWQLDPPDDLIAWTKANRYVRELTCEERAQYRVEPLCATKNN